MTVTDASLWVSRFLVGDAFHEISRAWLEKTVGAGSALVCPTSMLAEVAGAVARRTGSSQVGYHVIRQIRKVPTLQLVSITPEVGDLAAEIASTYRLRGGDALYVAVAYQFQAPLVSWDDEQIARVAGYINAYRPDA
jgi:predicted nucleic acid-binding protein